jgi:hypothetical protein
MIVASLSLSNSHALLTPSLPLLPLLLLLPSLLLLLLLLLAPAVTPAVA